MANSVLAAEARVQFGEVQLEERSVEELVLGLAHLHADHGHVGRVKDAPPI